MATLSRVGKYVSLRHKQPFHRSEQKLCYGVILRVVLCCLYVLLHAFLSVSFVANYRRNDVISAKRRNKTS